VIFIDEGWLPHPMPSSAGGGMGASWRMDPPSLARSPHQSRELGSRGYGHSPEGCRIQCPHRHWRSTLERGGEWDVMLAGQGRGVGGHACARKEEGVLVPESQHCHACARETPTRAMRRLPRREGALSG